MLLKILDLIADQSVFDQLVPEGRLSLLNRLESLLAVSTDNSLESIAVIVLIFDDEGSIGIHCAVKKHRIRILAAEPFICAHRLTGLGHHPFTVAIVGSNPRGITIELKTWSVHVTPVISVMVSTQLLYVTE